MPSLLREFLDSPRSRHFSDPRNIILYIFTIIVLAITWSGVKAVQTNYELQKQVTTLQQQNAVLDLQNQNIALQNEFYGTNQYLDLAARQQLGLAAPGETVLLVPDSVANKYVDSNIGPKTVATAAASSSNESSLIKNLHAWRDFLFGHKFSSQ